MFFKKYTNKCLGLWWLATSLSHTNSVHCGLFTLVYLIEEAS